MSKECVNGCVRQECKPTFRIPAEWEEQSAVWITWPCMPGWWANAREESLESFARLAAVISRYETVKINCQAKSPKACRGYSGPEDAKRRIEKALGNLSNIEFYDIPTNDVWCRDSGAIFALQRNSKLCALDFKYNSWGGKLPPWDLDDALASKMALAAGAEIINCRKMVCEGGALEFDGKGWLLTTECVVLNSNRNSGFTKAQAEEYLMQSCGIDRIIWLKDGLCGDDTDGHIDNLARFTPCGKILAASCDQSNASYANLQRNLDILKNAACESGKRYEIVELPVPKEPVIAKGYDGKDRILPASYANYLVVNNAVIMPSYSQMSDKFAEEILRSSFPGREIVAIDCRIFLMEGGAVHCLTQQEPAQINKLENFKE